MQAQLNYLVGLHRTKSTVSINSVTSFAGSTKTKGAFKRLCQDLYKVGVKAEMIEEKKSEILNIFQSQNTAIGGQTYSGKPHNSAASGQIGGNNTIDQSQLPAVSGFFFV